MKQKLTWAVVVIFAAAMAWVESAVVVYLRTLIDRIEPYQANPLPIFGSLGGIELGRETATLVMLATVGWLAGRSRRSRAAYACIAFGVWDIFYYIFLAPMSGWPHSLLDWDILFLLPLPWWGPVLAPASIAALMVVGGTLIVQLDVHAPSLMPRRYTWGASGVGIALALYAFMENAITASSRGAEAVRGSLPTNFNWGLFIVALVLMSAPIIEGIRQLWTFRNHEPFANSYKAGVV